MKAELINLIRELSYEKREVTLASGLKSNFYIDMKQTLLHAKGINVVAELILKELKKYEGSIVGVGGMSIGADPLATAVSMKSIEWKRPLNAFYIRKEPKSHGTSQWVEGMKNFKAGDSVFVLEDVVSTGGSSLKAVKRAEEAGLKVLGVLTCVDREMGGIEAIQKAGYKCSTLVTKREIEQ